MAASGLRIGATLLACAVLLALSASPASSRLARLPAGNVISYRPVVGPTGATPATIFDTTFSNLDYSGGPVMPSNTNYTIVWAPSSYTGPQFQYDYVAGVNQFFVDLAHDSGSHTNSDSVSTQYNDANGNTAAYDSTFGGSFTDTDPLPPNGCPALQGDICLTDAQLQSELDQFLSAHNLPRDLTHAYFLLTPPGVASCLDEAGTICSVNADLNQAFCAYHTNSATPVSFLYANIPDYAGYPGCDPYVTFCPTPGFFPLCYYPNTYGDAVVSGISHEHNEMMTDPQPNNAWADWQPSCGPNTCGEEGGDKCNQDEANDPSTNPHLINGPYGLLDAPYNQVINGRGYWLQREWSNQGHQCLDFWTSNGNTATASFTHTPGAGTTVNFDASTSTATGGVAEYVWQFNDASGPQPQNTTIETAQATISHTFPEAGTYDVALTVMGADGTSNGTAHIVSIGSATTTTTTSTSTSTSSTTTVPPPPTSSSSSTSTTSSTTTSSTTTTHAPTTTTSTSTSPSSTTTATTTAPTTTTTQPTHRHKTTTTSTTTSTTSTTLSTCGGTFPTCSGSCPAGTTCQARGSHCMCK